MTHILNHRFYDGSYVYIYIYISVYINARERVCVSILQYMIDD